MNRRAFRPSVDTESYFPAATHETALAAITSAFARREPVVLLDGTPGTGKSLVARLWLERLPTEVVRAVVPNVHAAQAPDLLQAILFDLDQPYLQLGEQELRLAVTMQLLSAAHGEYPVVLVIDDAQHLTYAAIEELRLLGNIEVPGGVAAFVLLIAQPSLRATVERQPYTAFAQRVAARPRIDPLTPEESVNYLRHQVRTAGGNPDRVFDDAAVSLLAGACGGVARLLNQAAGLAIDLAEQGEMDSVDAEAVLEALDRIGLGTTANESSQTPVITHTLPKQTPETTRRQKAKTTRKRSA